MPKIRIAEFIAKTAAPAASGNALPERAPEPAAAPVARPDCTHAAVVAARATISDPWRQLADDDRVKAHERERALREWFTLRDAGHTAAAAATLVAQRTDWFPVLSTAGQHNTTAITHVNLRRWAKRLGTRNGQPNWANRVALADQYRTVTRERQGDPEIWEHIHDLYAHENKLSLQAAYELAVEDYLEHHRHAVIHPATVPTLHQVSYWYRHHADQAALVRARDGHDAYRNHVAPFLHRDWSQVRPLDLLIGDHHLMDACCRVWDESRECWQATRPWLTAWLDAASGYLIGYLIRTESPNSLAIEDAFLSAIRNSDWQVPTAIYIDNGKDYCSRGWTEPVVWQEHEHSITRALGVKVVHALPYNARAKIIEGRFRQIGCAFAKLWGSYRGSNPQSRPDGAQAHWDNPESLPTIAQYCAAWDQWLHQHYHVRPNESAITNGRPPAEVWASRAPRREWSQLDLHRALLKPLAAPRTVKNLEVNVGRDGYRRIYYRAPELMAWHGRQVYVKIDRWCSDRVYLYEANGREICCAVKPTLAPALALDDDSRAQLETAMRDQAHLLKTAREGVVDPDTGRQRLVAPISRLALYAPEESGRRPLAGDPSAVSVPCCPSASGSGASPLSVPGRQPLSGSPSVSSVSSVPGGSPVPGAPSDPGPPAPLPPADAADIRLLDSILAGAPDTDADDDADDLAILAQITNDPNAWPTTI